MDWTLERIEVAGEGAGRTLDCEARTGAGRGLKAWRVDEDRGRGAGRLDAGLS
jgi:hypothetical protein